MKRLILILSLSMLFTACHHAAEKPVSNNITKTTVTVNGKKDSVLNNQEKNYSNATIADPCVKCLLSVIQQSDNFKKATQGIATKSIIYAFDWITSNTPRQINGSQINSGMRVSVTQKADTGKVNLVIYLYDNKNAKLYNKDAKPGDNIIPIDSLSMKKIRNSCFWGVASSK
jgi:hypothetical protein